MISRTQRILGLDIGSNTVKGVELAKNGDRFTVTGYAQTDISSAGTLREAILAVLREGRFKSKQVVSSVSGRSVIVRYVNTPLMKPEELKESMRFEADKYIPFELNEVILDCVPLEEKSDENGEMRVVLVAVKKDIVDEHVRLLQESGLYPYIIDVDCFALGNAFENASMGASVIEEESEWSEADQATGEGQAESEEEAEAEAEGEAVEAAEEAEGADDFAAEAQEMEVAAEEAPGDQAPAQEASEEDAQPESVVGALIPDLAKDADEVEQAEAAAADQGEAGPVTAQAEGGVYALVDIGAQKTNINIMNGQTSCFTREVYVGGEDMTEAVAKHLGISPTEAEAVKRQGDQEGAVLEAVGQTLDDLANEIFLSFDYFENQFESEIGAVYLSGGGSRLKGVGAVFSETLGRQVHLWDPAAGMDISLADSQAAKFRENAPQLAVAMGLASRLRKV